MITFVALLRGINAGRQKRLGMADLAELFQSLGFPSVKIYLRSGNVVFESPDEDPLNISAKAGENVSWKFGFPVTVVLRTTEKFLRVVHTNPFLGGSLDDTGIHVTFLAEVPNAEFMKIPMKGENGTDQYVIIGREIYLFCPGGYGRTKFSTTFFEKKLGVLATTRNWKTVNALADMARR